MPWLDAKISRRKFLKLAGSTMAVVVVGGTVWRAFSNGVFSSGQGPAYEPWKDWKTESEEVTGPLSLAASAILGANAHNTQPWLFVVNPDRIDMFADTKRNKPAQVTATLHAAHVIVPRESIEKAVKITIAYALLAFVKVSFCIN
jgi:hypothetical protein